MILVTPERRAAVLSQVEANPGVRALVAAREVGLDYDVVRAVVRDLRAAGVLAPKAALVPVPGFEVNALRKGQRDLYLWACDVLGTIDDAVDGLSIGWTTARRLAAELRALGAIEPAYGLWTTVYVEAAQDRAWDAARRVAA